MNVGDRIEIKIDRVVGADHLNVTAPIQTEDSRRYVIETLKASIAAVEQYGARQIVPATVIDLPPNGIQRR